MPFIYYRFFVLIFIAFDSCYFFSSVIFMKEKKNTFNLIRFANASVSANILLAQGNCRAYNQDKYITWDLDLLYIALYRLVLHSRRSAYISAFTFFPSHYFQNNVCVLLMYLHEDNRFLLSSDAQYNDQRAHYNHVQW